MGLFKKSKHKVSSSIPSSSGTYEPIATNKNVKEGTRRSPKDSISSFDDQRESQSDGLHSSSNVKRSTTSSGQSTEDRTISQSATAFNALRFTLETLRNASDVFAVPGMKAALSVLLSVIDKCQARITLVLENGKGFRDLFDRMNRLKPILIGVYKVDDKSGSLVSSLKDLESELRRLAADIESASSQGKLAKFINSTENAMSVMDHARKLDSIIAALSLGLNAHTGQGVDRLEFEVSQVQSTVDKIQADMEQLQLHTASTSKTSNRIQQNFSGAHIDTSASDGRNTGGHVASGNYADEIVQGMEHAVVITGGGNFASHNVVTSDGRPLQQPIMQNMQRPMYGGSTTQTISRPAGPSFPQPESKLDELKIAIKTLIKTLDDTQAVRNGREVKFALRNLLTRIDGASAMPRNGSDLQRLVERMQSLQLLFPKIRMGAEEEVRLARFLKDLQSELQTLAMDLDDAGNSSRATTDVLVNHAKILGDIIEELPINITQPHSGWNRFQAAGNTFQDQIPDGQAVEDSFQDFSVGQVGHLDVDLSEADADTEGGGIVNGITGLRKLDMKKGKFKTGGGDIGCYNTAFNSPNPQQMAYFLGQMTKQSRQTRQS